MSFERWTRIARLWLRALFRREQVERELDEELTYHVDRHREELVARGMAQSDARTAALRAIGGIEVRKEQSRDARGTRWLEDLGRDTAYALRTMRRTPSSSGIIVLTLALGIGATTAIFTLLDGVVLRTLPVRDPESLVIVQRMARAPDGKISERNMPYPSFLRLREDTAVVTQLVAMALSKVNARVGASVDAEPHDMMLVSGEFFTMLGVGATSGRVLDAADDQPGAPGVVVLSYDYWLSRHGGDERIVGSTIRASDAAFTVVGVATRGFSGVSPGYNPDLYFPVTAAPVLHRSTSALSAGNGFLAAMARLREGVTHEQASTRLSPLYIRARIETSGGRADSATLARFRGTSIEVQPGGRGLAYMRLQFGKPLIVLMGMVALVLTIACGNIANLLVARAGARRREVAVRLSIGAGRRRIVRQLLTESVVLALAGGAAGVLVARLGSRMLAGMLNAEFAVLLDVTPNTRILVFATGISVLTALGFGLAPALLATRVDLATLRDGAVSGLGARGRRRVSRALVVLQVALSIVLLVGMGLFVQTFVAMRNMDLGFDRENVAVVYTDPRTAGYGGARMTALYTQLLERARTMPGVRDAAFADITPLSGSSAQTNLAVEGRTPVPDEPPNAFLMRVTPDYFRVIQQPLLAGTVFERGESGRTQVVVNEAFGRDLAKGRVLGRRLGFDRREGAPLPLVVTGVVKDATLRTLREQVRPAMYSSFLGDTTVGSAFLVLRFVGESAPLLGAVRSLFREVDPRLEIIRAETLQSQFEAGMLRERFVATLASFFGVLALLLAAIGLYGVVSQAVLARVNEIGVRMALGATRLNVVLAVLREAIGALALGVAIGLALSWGATKSVAGLLYGVSPTDPVTVAVCVATLTAIALVASYLPARRAALIDPVNALRAE
jgi:predicted permease